MEQLQPSIFVCVCISCTIMHFHCLSIKCHRLIAYLITTTRWYRTIWNVWYPVITIDRIVLLNFGLHWPFLYVLILQYVHIVILQNVLVQSMEKKVRFLYKLIKGERSQREKLLLSKLPLTYVTSNFAIATSVSNIYFLILNSYNYSFNLYTPQMTLSTTLQMNLQKTLKKFEIYLNCFVLSHLIL